MELNVLAVAKIVKVQRVDFHVEGKLVIGFVISTSISIEPTNPFGQLISSETMLGKRKRFSELMATKPGHCGGYSDD